MADSLSSGASGCSWYMGANPFQIVPKAAGQPAETQVEDSLDAFEQGLKMIAPAAEVPADAVESQAGTIAATDQELEAARVRAQIRAQICSLLQPLLLPLSPVLSGPLWLGPLGLGLLRAGAP